MPTSILSQNQYEKEFFNAISSFFGRFKIGDLLRVCNAQKEKGIPVIRIFKYKLCNVFTGCQTQKTCSDERNFCHAGTLENSIERWMYSQLCADGQLVFQSGTACCYQNHRLDSIAMIKKNSCIRYEYDGEQLSINKIFGICKKGRGSNKYLLP